MDPPVRAPARSRRGAEQPSGRLVSPGVRECTRQSVECRRSAGRRRELTVELQRFGKRGGSRSEVTELGDHEAEVPENEGGAPCMLELPRRYEALLEEREGSAVVARDECDLSEIAERTRDPFLVSRRARDGEALLVQPCCGLEVVAVERDG